ncbi:MAG: hypothetical protein C5B50_24730 [Verrucomicrobia bacterium]|nr:MAG: hypothetical protein C5B50_24730 [Verrucomicrobiota bacterium]
MRLLDRYLLREWLVPLAYCLCGLEILLITADLFRRVGDFKSKGLRGSELIEYYLTYAGEWLGWMLPLALLLALLYSLSNHARHQELTAIRAAGISLWRLSLPYCAIGILASLALLAVNEIWSPNSDDVLDQICARHAARRTGKQTQEERHNLSFESWGDRRQWHRAWRIGVVNETATQLRNIVVLWTREDNTWLHLEADRAIWSNGRWTFYNVLEQKETLASNAFPVVPVLKTNMMVMPQISETPEQIESSIRIGEKMSKHLARESEIPIKDIFSYLRLHPKLERHDSNWLYTKLHGRLAGPWTCLVAVLIAIPFGAVSGRRNVYVGVASSVSILLIFWVAQQLALFAGAAGMLQPWLAGWLPNGAFGLAGLIMTGRAR